MSAAPPPFARLAGVFHRYRGTVALDGIDLELPAACMIGLVGPDGVGKSSLLALICGARKIQRGTIEVLGGDMRDRRHRAATCPRIAYMPQGLGRNLYATLSIFENLEFFGRLYDLPREERHARIAELLEATGLAPFAARAVGDLSGGMKQKLGLCCALLHDPDLLVLDEPTTGVDPLSRRQFWQLIARLRLRHPLMSVLVSTAYFEEADAFDRLVVMDAGRVLAFGTPAEVKALGEAKTLEAAFVALLPRSRREGYGALAIAPVAGSDAAIAIEAETLTRRFGDFVAVDGVSFRIRRGEIYGFIGSNGCGKTTTMKMLTGLLPISGGRALLFGKPVDARDLETRRRVGFMSQSFSLYTELTVRQNLRLHANLFHLPPGRIEARVAELAADFDLVDFLDSTAEAVPLGVRQRLSLAVAVIHEPEVLILDEPTSGVDPVARDRFWRLLARLSRERGVTIFLSTHFMTEAQRCDRIALMHAGVVLAEGSPAEIVRNAGTETLEDAFIACMGGSAAPEAQHASPALPGAKAAARPTGHFSLRRFLAHARREALEMARDPVRLAFALLGPVALMLVFSFGVTFDLEDVAFATLDGDRTPESRAYLESFSRSRYFEEHHSRSSGTDLERRLRDGELRFVIEVPPGFGRDLRRGASPEVSIQVDGAFPFRGQTVRSYVEGAHAVFVQQLLRDKGAATPRPLASVAVRMRYNPDFRSSVAVIPGVMMIILMLIPSVTTAVGIVREKELGSITNLYATPTTGLEFMLGKQVPYVALAMVNFATLVALALIVFRVPLKGSIVALTAGGFLYVAAATAFGLLVSSFVRTQIAAIFATAILASLPTVQYSGFMLPVSSMSPDTQLVARIFPPMYFEHVSVGTFTKGLGLADVAPDLAAMALILVALLAIARLALKTQEA